MSHILEYTTTAQGFQQSQISLETANRASSASYENSMMVNDREGQDIGYRIHTHKVECDQYLEKWQLEEEIAATDQEVKRLHKEVKRVTKEHISKLNKEVEHGAYNVSYYAEEFSKKLKHLAQKQHEASGHAGRLRWVKDYYLPSLQNCRGKVEDQTPRLQTQKEQLMLEETIKEIGRREALSERLKKIGMEGLKAEVEKIKRQERHAQVALDNLKDKHTILLNKCEILNKIESDNKDSHGVVPADVMSYTTSRGKALAKEMEELKREMDVWKKRYLDAREALLDMRSASGLGAFTIYDDGDIRMNYEAFKMGLLS